LVQAKLDSIGVNHVRTTSLENEMMVNSVVRVSDKMNQKFGGSSLKMLRELTINSIKSAYEDASNDPDKYEDYAVSLYNLSMQCGALSQKILNNEGDSFQSYVDLTQETMSDEENDVYGEHGEETVVRAGFAEDPILIQAYSKEVALINKTLEDIQMIKALKGIEN
jgi:hypothetical protein